MSSPFLAVKEPIRAARTPAEAVEECLVRSAEALHEAKAATHTEISHALVAARKLHAEGLPVDLLDSLARVLGHAEEQLAPIVAELGEIAARPLAVQPPPIPFAGKLIAPTAFYELHDSLHKLGRALLAPVLYAEDTDAIGVGSVNPIAATIMAEEVLLGVERRANIRPFVTVARIDYDSWTFLTRKHFGI